MKVCPSARHGLPRARRSSSRCRFLRHSSFSAKVARSPAAAASMRCRARRSRCCCARVRVDYLLAAALRRDAGSIASIGTAVQVERGRLPVAGIVAIEAVCTGCGCVHTSATALVEAAALTQHGVARVGTRGRNTCSDLSEASPGLCPILAPSPGLQPDSQTSVLSLPICK